MLSDGEIYSPKDLWRGLYIAAALWGWKSGMQVWCQCLNHLLKFLWNVVFRPSNWAVFQSSCGKLQAFFCFILSCIVHYLILSVPGCCLSKLCLVVVKGCTVPGQGWKRRCADGYRVGQINYGKRSSLAFWRWLTNKNWYLWDVRNYVTWRATGHHWVLPIKAVGIDICLPLPPVTVTGITFLLFEAS